MLTYLKLINNSLVAAIIIVVAKTKAFLLAKKALNIFLLSTLIFIHILKPKKKPLR